MNRDISFNKITEIPERFNQWFEFLNFMHNSLTSIPDLIMLSTRSSSRYFFDNNKITTLPKVNGSKMKSLSLSHNSIKEFPMSFSSLSYLFVLCSYNNLLLLLSHAAWFRWIDDNKLEKLRVPRTLDYLNAEYNSLKEFPSFDFGSSSSSCTFVKKLCLRNNTLTALPYSLNSSCYLKTLFVLLNITSNYCYFICSWINLTVIAHGIHWKSFLAQWKHWRVFHPCLFISIFSQQIPSFITPFL